MMDLEVGVNSKMLACPSMVAQVYGKWILAGEHSVLRGCPALVFPVFSRGLTLKYFDESCALKAEFTGELGSELRLLFWGVIEKACEMLGHSREKISGRFILNNSIAVGAGLGASAALCVAIGRWFVWKKWVSESELYEFARQLENLFHGESSGVDIAVAINSRGLHFERAGRRTELEPRWKPNWYLSYTGKRGVTAECVNKVKSLWDTNLAVAQSIDRDMRKSVELAEEALLSESDEVGLHKLADAINGARTCFERWGLTSGQTGEHLSMLMARGALAVKPTGSGDGGFALSLWEAQPPAELLPQLIFLGR